MVCSSACVKGRPWGAAPHPVNLRASRSVSGARVGPSCVCSSSAVVSDGCVNARGVQGQGSGMSTHRVASDRFPLALALSPDCLRAASTPCRTVVSDRERADLPRFPCLRPAPCDRCTTCGPSMGACPRAMAYWFLYFQPISRISTADRSDGRHTCTSTPASCSSFSHIS